MFSIYLRPTTSDYDTTPYVALCTYGARQLRQGDIYVSGSECDSLRSQPPEAFRVLRQFLPRNAARKSRNRSRPIVYKSITTYRSLIVPFHLMYRCPF